MLSFHARLSVAFLLGSSMLLAQQPASGTSQHPVQATATKRHPSNKTNSTPAAVRVDVINGAEKRTQVFHQEESNATNDKKPVGNANNHSSRQKGEPPLTSVEIFNGATVYTKTFNESTDETSAQRAQRMNAKPVVIGVSNGGTTSRNGRLQPVVTGVASSESNNGAGNKQPVVVGIASSGAESGKALVQSVQTGGAPHSSKRQPYRGPTSNP